MAEFAGTARFAIVRQLGSGGMGVVYEAFDREQGTTCALKLLPSVTPERLLRFKQEFRTLQGIHHVNLVALGELLHEDGHWFYTMELVPGSDFLAHVRPGDIRDAAPTPATATFDDGRPMPIIAEPAAPDGVPRFDEERLMAGLVQLATGLLCLHDAGKIHRDIKPSNILVTAAGRVVLLDFGIAGDVSRVRRAPGTAPLIGTPAYMAPEQLEEGLPVGPPADMYAVGVVLYKALTGQLPFTDSSVGGLLRRRQGPPRPPGERVAAVPPLLDELCIDLLRPEPGLRPDARELLARLGVSATPALGRQPFVGRRRELGALMAAYERSRGGPALVALEGPSGIGKTALVRELMAALSARHDAPLILDGRCYEHEGIPYRAVDGVMDAVGEHLLRLPIAEVPELAQAPLLALLFPALRRTPPFSATAEPPPGDPVVQRRDAEQVGRALFAALARERPLVITIDDFQWADDDSIAFLRAVTAPPGAPPLLLVLSSRTTVPEVGSLIPLHIPLEPLTPDEARELAARLLDETDLPGASPASIVAEAGGHPFFITELARTPIMPGESLRLDDVLWQRVQGLGAGARLLLELVAVAGAPIAQEVVAAASGLAASELAGATQELRGQRLVGTAGPGRGDLIEPFHDRVRETVVTRLDADARRDRHRRLADAIAGRRPDDLEALVRHLEGAGELARAGELAVRAGDAARAALAFDRAASFYRAALGWLPAATTSLRVKLAEALGNAGRGAEAAVEYHQAARENPSPDILRRAAEHELRSGRLDEGLDTLQAVLDTVGIEVPRSPLGAFASLMLRRTQVRVRGLAFRERPAAEIPPAELLLIDTLWGAAASLGAVDTIRGADFQARHLLAALAAGEPFRVTRALLAEAIFQSTGGPKNRPRAEALLLRARGLLGRLANPYATAMTEFATGLAGYEFGRYREAMGALDRAAELFRTTCTGATHDAAIASRFALDNLFYLGELAEMAARAPRLLDDAVRRGDLYLAAELRTGLPNLVWLMADDPDGARAATEAGISTWSRRAFFLQHYYDALAQAHIRLYLGDGAGAREIIETAWRGLRTSLLLQIETVKVEALYLRGRAALLAGALSVADKTASRLAASPMPTGPGFAMSLRAGIAGRRGSDWRGLLGEAEQRLDEAGATMFAAACRWHLGDEDVAVWHKQGVVRPARFAALLVPAPRSPPP